MVYFKARLKTGGKTPEQILATYEGPGQVGPKPNANEVEALIKALNGIDGIELIVMKSFNGNYVPASWRNEDDEKMMEFVYQAEQDPFFGTYINEREEFIKDWKSGEYEPAGTLVFDCADVEIIEELKRMRVFKMNDCDWVAAENEKQAKEFYQKETGFDTDEIETDFEGEVPLSDTMFISLDDLPEEELQITQILNTKQYGGETLVAKTFGWVINHENITKPCIICSTEY